MIRVDASEPVKEWDAATLAGAVSGRADAAVILFLESAMELQRVTDAAAGAAVAGALLDKAVPEPMQDDALARTFAAIDRLEAVESRMTASRDARRGGATYRELIDVPMALQAVIAKAEAGRGWRGMGPGVRQLELSIEGATAKAEILRIAPGASVPRHTHAGSELTLCLVGGFSDGRGAYARGDISVADPSVRHQPKADADGPCFVLAVSDGDLRFEGLLGLAQRLFGR